MNDSRTAVEGASLEETLQKASETLGVAVEELDYELDRDHFKNGAETVRIFADKRDPENASIQDSVEKFLTTELTQRNEAARVRAKVTNGSVDVVISAPPGTVQDDDESINALAEVLREVAGELGDRKIDIRFVIIDPDPPRFERGRDRDRGDRRGGDRRGRDRDRGDRRGNGRSDRDRGDRGDRRGRDRDRDRDRGRPEKDPKRDQELRDRAKSALKVVLRSGEPVTLENLNSYERRIVHRTVAPVKGVTTKSLGDGSLKSVEIYVGSDEEAQD